MAGVGETQLDAGVLARWLDANGAPGSGEQTVLQQLKGGSQPEPLFDVAQIDDLVLLDQHFARPGPNYKKNDSAMRRRSSGWP